MLRSDLIFHILLFLQPKDGMSLAITNKMCYDVYKSDSLWKCYLTLQFKSFCQERHTSKMISFYKHILKFPTYKKLFEISEKLSFDLIGNYRGKSVLPCGHYFRIIPVEYSPVPVNSQSQYTLTLEEYDEKMKLLWFANIYYNDDSNSLLCSGCVKDKPCLGTLTIETNRIQLRWIKSSFEDCLLQLYRLPILLEPSDSLVDIKRITSNVVNLMLDETH